MDGHSDDSGDANYSDDRDSGIRSDGNCGSTDKIDNTGYAINEGELNQHLLTPVKYTSRDKSVRLNHGGFDANTRDEKEFSESVYPSIKEVLRLGGPYPQTIRSGFGDYWYVGFHDQSAYSWVGDSLLQAVASPDPPYIEDQCEDMTYRKHYIGQEHLNFYGRDDKHGPIIMSIKVETGQYRVIIRCLDGNFERHFGINDMDMSGPLNWAQSIIPDLNMKATRFYPVMCINAWQRILTFDEHANMRKNHKFAVFFQQSGQTNEDEILANKTGSKKFAEFMRHLGKRVKLSDHKGFTGGLNSSGSDGEYSLYTQFNQREVMFHVSTMLPTSSDPDNKQQVDKKRHLGNDIVAIVFQDSNTPFCPTLMKTKVTHAYVVVQPMEIDGPTQYKVSVCCRKDVPDFGPKLPEPPVFRGDKTFRQFLMCKLINAETACYSSTRWDMLRQRNRSDLIETLHDELSMASDGMNTKRPVKRPVNGQKSFFDAIQHSQHGNHQYRMPKDMPLRRLNSSSNSSSTSEAREQKKKILRRSGVRRELNLKYQQKLHADSGISSVHDTSSSGPETCSELDRQSYAGHHHQHSNYIDGEIHLSDDTDASYNDAHIDEDDSLIDVSMNTDFGSNDILTDLKKRINSVSSRVSLRSRDLREESMTELITRKLSAISMTRKASNDSMDSETFGFEQHSSSGYDSSPPVKQFTSVYKQQHQQETPTTAYTSAYASEEESEIVPPPQPRKLPAGAVAMPHMMAI